MERAVGKAFVVGALLVVLAAGRDAWAALPHSAAPPPKPSYEAGVSVYLDAWAARKSTTADAAMTAYVELVKRLSQKYG